MFRCFVSERARAVASVRKKRKVVSLKTWTRECFIFSSASCTLSFSIFPATFASFSRLSCFFPLQPWMSSYLFLFILKIIQIRLRWFKDPVSKMLWGFYFSENLARLIRCVAAFSGFQILVSMSNFNVW